jgi:signal transduction histidine kinase
VLETQRAQLVNDLSDAALASIARDAEHLRLLRALEPRSYIGVPLRARGNLLGVLFLFGAKHLTESDLATAEELARRAGLALDNARLFREAEEASRTKSEFLATMSHELRTPLTAIIGYQALLADGITGPVTDAQRQQLRRIKVSATHLLGLIDEVLTFSRIEAAREMPRLERVDAGDVVRRAAEMIEPLAAEKSLALTVTAPPAPLVLHTDASKLRQILVNLLSNAVKFTERGEIALALRADGTHAVFEVRDTGVGIAPEHLERIFDPFWQVERQPTRKAGGTGLGLSVTRRLADLLGGDVTVESTPGAGSTFRVRLPLEN